MIVKESKKSIELKELYKDSLVEMATVGDLTSIKVENENIGFMVLPDMGKYNDSMAKLIPYEDSKSKDWSVVSPIHYANLYLSNFMTHNVMNIFKGISGDRLSDRCAKLIVNISEHLNESEAKLYVKVPKNKEMELKVTKKMVETIRVGIYLNRGTAYILTPYICFDSKLDSLTAAERLTAYGITKAFNKYAKEVTLSMTSYSIYEETLIMMSIIKNFFLDFIDGKEVTFPVDIEDFRDSIKKYIKAFKGAKPLVSTQPVLNKEEYNLHYASLLLPYTTKGYIRFNEYSEEEDVAPPRRGSVKFYKEKKKEKEKKSMTVVQDTGIKESIFKEKVRESLSNNRYEPVRIMDLGDDVSNMNRWVREVALALKKEMIELGVEPHPSIIMTLGEKLPEEFFNPTEEVESTATLPSSNLPLGVVDSQMQQMQQMQQMLNMMGNSTNSANGMNLMQAQQLMGGQQMAPQPMVQQEAAPNIIFM